MSTVSSTRYANVPRQTQATGSATLVLPIARHWPSYVAGKAVECFDKLIGNREPITESQWETASLGPEVFEIQHWVPDPDRQAVEWDGTAVGLRQLSANATELVSSNGAWREQYGAPDEIVRQAVTEFMQRLQQFLKTGLSAPGQQVSVISAAHQRLRDEFSKQSREMQSWTSSQSQSLTEVSQQFQRASQLRGPAGRFFLRMYPDGPIRWLLPEKWKRQLTRHLKTLSQYTRQRGLQIARELRLRVLAQIAGRDESMGKFEPLFAELAQLEQFVSDVKSQLTSQVVSRPQPRDEIHLFESLNAPLDRDRGTTARTLFDEKCAAAGATPSGWASEVEQQGLLIGNRQLRPWELQQCSPRDVANAMMESVGDYLGSTDLSRILNTVQPSTALEHVASFSLLSPEFRPTLEKSLDEWIRRSLPYATFERISGAVPKQHAFFFCFGEERREWNNLLRNRVDITEAAREGAYSIAHPHRAVLLQVIQGAPGGGMKELKRWMAGANETRRLNLVKPLFDRHAFPEMRLLAERVRDRDDCKQLFEAGRRGGIIKGVEAEQSMFVLSRPDWRFDRLFRERRLRRHWREARFFLDLVQDTIGYAFLEREFAEIPDVGNLLFRLSQEAHTSQIVSELSSAGLIEEHSGQFRISRERPASLHDLPLGVYEVIVGPLRGLDRDRFIGQLLENDLLYNVTYWGVFDLSMRQMIQSSVVPESVRMSMHKLA